MSKEDLLISSDDLFDIYVGEHSKYETVKVEESQDANWRHGFGGFVIFKDPETGKFYTCSWRSSSNDMMTWDDMNYGEQRCYEVEPKQKTITVYEKIN